ncbi:MAG: hypothetical protein CMP98_05050 [Gammaproteobacteria bacterium]|nr:hypothetical protein [Gammaproteobacteria bacterium]OUU10384.1 MAG: hypothetical protein CBB94_05200 [Gammaproteobacteria bacterium TMED34]|tara:strand:- start:1017 stop:1652 length:636 start_codon:yes stop_codon:yes gene_type:complete
MINRYRVRQATKQRLSTIIVQLSSVLVMTLSQYTFSDWQLQTEYSSLSFTSVKNSAITESHHFPGLTGFVASSGSSEITIDLGSIETGIPIRNQRMQKLLFDIDEYPYAIFSSNIDMSEISQLQTGQSMRLSLRGNLDLHGQTGNLTIPIQVTRSSHTVFVISTTRPIVISADQFELGAGIEALKDIAGLAHITPTVPVSFTLVFEETNQE